jgi:ABC-type multidrug transport system permease subunit
MSFFSFQRFRAATIARSLEFLRDRSALAWNLMFPVLMVLGFAAIFSGPGQPVFKVAVIAPVEPSAELHPFLATPHIQFYRENDLDAARRKVARHRIDLLLEFSSDATGVHPRYWVNPESAKGALAEKLLLAAGGTTPDKQQETGKAIRYVDWAVPGILGVNLMFSCLWGVGYVIVRYRKSGHLKRLNATPLRALEFVSAQIVSRLALVMTTTTLMFVGCNLFMHFPMEGSYLDLFVLTLIGALSLTSMGLLVAARVGSEEISGGLLNLISSPMMILSGAFFSLDGSPRWVQAIADVFPLTHLLSAARSIMLDGVPLLDLGGPLLMLLGTTAACMAFGSLLFKWTSD